MPERYRVLAASIRAELPAIERAISHAAEAVRRSDQDADDAEFFLEAAAFSVHSAYTAVERVLQEISRVVDETQPAGCDWHRDLVRQMGLAPVGLRPAVLPEDVAAELHEILWFRHLVRNSYASALDSARVASNVQRFERVEVPLREALLDFADWLERASSAR